MAQQPIPNSVYDIIIDMHELNQITSCGYLLELSPALQEKVKQHIAARIGMYTAIAKDEINSFSHSVGFEDLEAIGAILDQESKLRVAFTGLFNRGKTFCINRLASVLGDKNELPSGKQVSTRGISFIKSIFTLLDTMGTNAPLLLESIERAKKHVEKEFPQIDKPEKFANQTEFNEYRKKCQDREAKVAVRAYEIAAINKKCIEAFLQNLIFSLAQAMVVVVNELTFQDQINIEGIVQTMKNHLADRAKKRFTLDKYQKIIVIHNYVTCATLDEFAKLKQKYVFDVFYGTTNKVEVAVDGGTTQIEVHEPGNAETIHLFLGKDGTEAGALNKATFTYLKNILQVQTFSSQEKLATRLCFDLRNLLQVHFKNVTQVDMVVNDNHNLGFKMLAASELKFKTDKLEKSEYGFEMQLSKNNAVEIKADVFYDLAYMAVLVDLAGFCPSGYDRASTIKNSIKFSVNNERELVIEGERCLHFRSFINPLTGNYVTMQDEGSASVSTGTAYTLPPNTSAFSSTQCCVYALESEANESQRIVPNEKDWDTRERPYGRFTKRIPIPFEYESRVAGANLEDGVLQLILLAEEKGDDGNDTI